jgi:hypothetical protein
MLHIQPFLSARPHAVRRFTVTGALSSCLLTIALSLICGVSQAAGGSLFRSLTPETANLNPYKWHYRPLVIFAPSETDADYVQQMSILEKSKAELAERDIMVLSDTSPTSKGQLRSQLNPQGFEVVLVGKDGGMKLRQQTPLSLETLLSTVDSMPMRKAHLDSNQ